ncbi:MAG: protein kinase [Rhodospirillaceae bacterium]|nr:protein kinase [Rhodospirillaceae bacterium]
MQDLHLSALPAGAEIEGYRLRGVLGAGGFGVTYLAEEIALSRSEARLVALKEFLPSSIAARVSGSREVRSLRRQDAPAFRQLLDRFLGEAETLARFDHPNIVPVLRYFEANGTAYIVMKFAEGESLGSILKRRGKLTEAEIRWFLPGLLDGLEEVHRRNFLHRDVKPDNVLVGSGGHAMLIDFGAARLAAAETSALTRTAVISEGYAPYEQYDSHGRQGPWSDLYGLAATLYRAVTGAAPVKSPDRLIAKVRDERDPLVPAGELAAGLSPAMSQAIERGLSLMEQDRPQSVAAFRKLLGSGEVPEAAPFELAPPPLPERQDLPPIEPGITVDRPLSGGPPIGRTLAAAPRRPRAGRGSRRAWGWIATTSLLVLVVAGPGFYYWKEMNPAGREAPPGSSASRADRAPSEKRQFEAQRRPEPAKPAPAPPVAAGTTCPGLPKALDGAFADAADCTLIDRTLNQALGTAGDGTITRWNNLKTGASGTIKLGAAPSRNGQACRQVDLTVTRGGDTKRASATACLKDGRWGFVD